jgi:hypothetical protein
MKKQPWVGLVCAGQVSRTGLARIARLDEQLGWIKSNTVATASRAVNGLKAGRAIRDYESLSKAHLILIQAPGETIEPITEALAASGLHWPGKSVALFHSVLDSSALSRLERLGASVASFALLGDSPPKFLLEGQPDAVAMLRRFFRHSQTTAIQIEHGRKSEYLAGVYAATAEFMPLISKAVERFRRAGMDKAEAGSTAALLIESSMRAYFRSGMRLLQGSDSQPTP